MQVEQGCGGLLLRLRLAASSISANFGRDEDEESISMAATVSRRTDYWEVTVTISEIT